ncbi:hypothetical protein GS505_12165 [Rhodococcus hoagii]|uniref:DRBM domain-containing protein n=1 Tax=Rhodococcus hoagii TaxID=43767 RepID=A0AAE4ZHY1_RHOHA|nr:hypothetical protein [Prescottella equi]
MRDTRRVQTAVLKSAGSDDPVLMPMERWDALALRAALAHQSVWCGRLLGGCGRQLTTRIGRQRVPHFAHFPDVDGASPLCHRLHTDGSSADHLFINRDVRDLLHRHGRRPGTTRFDGEFDTGGGCQWVTIDLADGRGVVVVALRGADLSDWEEREDRLRSAAPWVSWVFGPGLRAPQRLLQRDGFAMHLMFDDRAQGRPLQLGTQLLGAPTEWIDFHDARLDDDGLLTPASADARCTHRDTLTPVTTPPSAVADPESQLSNPPQPPQPSEPRTAVLSNGIEMSLPELRAPFQQHLDTELGVQSRRIGGGVRPLDPGPSVDRIPLPADVIAVLRDLGWNPLTDPLHTRWLKLAGTHSSYLYETHAIDTDPRVLDMLQELGKRWLGLAVLDCFTREYQATSAGEQSQVLASLRFALFNLLGTRSKLAGHLLLSHGEAQLRQDPAYRAKSRIDIDGVLQICGAVALLGGVDALYELTRRWYGETKDSLTEGTGAADSVDWKTALRKLDAAVVFDTTSSGPDHDRTFTTTVTDRQGRVGGGKARSKKLAERVAADSFMRMHAPRDAARLIASARTSYRYEPQVRPQVLPREPYPAQWRAIDTARDMFGLTSAADPSLTQALIHTSWVHENKAVANRASQRDNTVLAHHGSVVVDALAAQRRVEQVLASTLTPTADEARIMVPAEQVWRDAFAASPMVTGLFLGKGEAQHPARSYANAMQAVLAVAWRFRGRELLRAIPVELSDHFNRASDGSTDHYTRLAESCRPFGVEFAETYKAAGPDHDKVFTCTLEMTSPEGRVSVVSEPVQSRSLSKQEVAGRVLDLVESTSGCDDWQLDADDLSVVEFLLRTQLTHANRVKQSHLSRLVSRGALGTTYLATEDVSAFAAWAEQVEELVGGVDGDRAEELRRYYARCLVESGRGVESRKPLRAAVDHLRREARGLGLSDADRRLFDAVHRVMRASLECDARERAAVAETVRWVVVTADRHGGRIGLRQDCDTFTITVPDMDARTVLDPLVPLMRAQFPTLTVDASEDAITVGCEPVPAAKSILQAGALALADSATAVRRVLYDAVRALHDAVVSGDRVSIETALDDLDRLLGA